ncbi:MAG: hypothetical protein A2622_05820 [Bdellovibrionales bacterium RIFCSPHIGHO2_01_FULL_40_29]|nr:MAG: hypothetical protein A2622_05820 [Bdellovibrionales bacterium RIFCSPHIGHO2_01_FULL_40_29]OFZ34971.1 MAG: hypothetical protein A3D17_06170 [Bdellovibrionales bacterium RIFCSPHIGHO2_02_FULL_40_15]
MKKIVFAIIALVSISASAKYITVEVCDRGESGDRCEMVTYKVRPPSQNTPAEILCPVGDHGFTKCNKNAHVPAWLKKFNKHFLDAGFTAPKEDDLYRN